VYKCIAVFGFLNVILCKSPQVSNIAKKVNLSCRIDLFFPSWNVTVSCYNVVLFRHPLFSYYNPCCYGVSTLEDGRDTGITTVGNNRVSTVTLEDGRDTDNDTELSAVGNNGVSTQEGADTKLTAVGN
jgi:hypothetical protein